MECTFEEINTTLFTRTLGASRSLIPAISTIYMKAFYLGKIWIKCLFYCSGKAVQPLGQNKLNLTTQISPMVK